VRRRGIGPSVMYRLEGCTSLGNGVDNVEQVTRRPCQPIEPRHN
jgi:hypothetical protein